MSEGAPELEHLHALLHARVSGIYVLRNSEKIVTYVGQARNLALRAQDSYAAKASLAWREVVPYGTLVVRVCRADLNAAENAAISLLNPLLNKNRPAAPSCDVAAWEDRLRGPFARLALLGEIRSTITESYERSR